MSSQQYSYYATGSQPVSVPQKPGQFQPSLYGPPAQGAAYGASPPEAPDSSVASGTTGGPTSYGEPTATHASTSSYAGSASEYASSESTAGSVDLLDYMSDRVSGAYDPVPLDRSLAKQAQTSGQLNAKTQEIARLRALAEQRLAAVQADFSQGMKTAKGVERDLQWTQRKVNDINARAQRKYPEQYRAASQRYPAPVDY
ncbi:hypothetical protein BDY21DRAFT_285971 [Lineolata rhizophorae]|uniref:Biogenesis of lysosome-related organelles complex 1 subunit KXD1 n=1 Tax=Lineolata rhizophorae TaxID=578093 RepID=A0A6A6P0N8_9PEZI|nr:hypothetical protein BDY21DRAFT_285971 [Lineolata rhizophorae]